MGGVHGAEVSQAVSAEVRHQLVDLLRAGRTPEDLSSESEPSAEAISNRDALADRETGKRKDGLTGAERDELSRRLGVTVSGFYAWRDRVPPARQLVDEALSAMIQAIQRRSRETYGAPRAHAELALERDCRIGRKRVARLMGAAGLQGVLRKRFIRMTVCDPKAAPGLNLVERSFQAAGPDRLWESDITYIPTWSGFPCLSIVLDAWSRRVVHWATETRLRTEFALATLNMA